MTATSDRDRTDGGAPTRNGNGHDEHREPVVTGTTPAEDIRTVLIHRITWSAVFAGVAISLVTQLLLNMLGLGVGIGAVDPATANAQDAGNWSLGAAVWAAMTTIIAATIGGYAAGRLSGRPERSTAAWHGLTAWAFATLAVIWLLGSTLSQVVGGTATTAATAAQGQQSQGGAASGLVRSIVPPNITHAAVPFSAVEQQFRADTGDANAVRELALSSLRELTAATRPIEQAAARERANVAVARALNVPVEVAAQRVAYYEQLHRSAQQTPVAGQSTQQTLQNVQSTASWSMIGAALALALAALAAWWAGGAAAVHPTITDAARSLRTVRIRRTEAT
jgi:hypothetical protein